jgi:hypothetical protein
MEKKNEPGSRTKKHAKQKRKKNRDNNGQSREEYHIEKEPNNRSKEKICSWFFFLL